MLRREYPGLFAMALIYTLVDYITAYRFGAYELSGQFPYIPIRISFYVLLICLVLMLVLRTLKHHTTVLNRVEEEIKNY